MARPKLHQPTSVETLLDGMRVRGPDGPGSCDKGYGVPWVRQTLQDKQMKLVDDRAGFDGILFVPKAGIA